SRRHVRPDAGTTRRRLPVTAPVPRRHVPRSAHPAGGDPLQRGRPDGGPRRHRRRLEGDRRHHPAECRADGLDDRRPPGDCPPRGAEQGVEVEADPAPAEIEGVPETLRRAINNLTDNALKASPAGSRVVLASGKNHDGWAWVAVADEGKGIDPSVVEKGSKRG